MILNPSATLFTTDSKLTGLGMNRGLFRKVPVASPLSHYTALCCLTPCKSRSVAIKLLSRHLVQYNI